MNNNCGSPRHIHCDRWNEVHPPLFFFLFLKIASDGRLSLCVFTANPPFLPVSHNPNGDFTPASH